MTRKARAAALTPLELAAGVHAYAVYLLAIAPGALPHRCLRIADMAADQLSTACKLLQTVSR